MKQALLAFLKDQGVCIVGVADISGLDPAATMGYSRAVSFGVAVDPEVVSRILDGPTQDYFDAYINLNQKLDGLALACEEWLAQRGQKAYGLSRDRLPYDREAFVTAFPYKTAATLAGLGWVGKNALLVTPAFGSSVRISCVLTDAPLDPDAPVAASRCGGCTKCADICPGRAIRGVTWTRDTGRDALVDVAACVGAAARRNEGLDAPGTVCGMCMAVCPYTQKAIRAAGITA